MTVINYNKRFYFAFLLVLVLVLTAFGGALGNEFVWDDLELVLGIEAYRKGDLVRILTTAANTAEYQPIRDLTLAMDFALWGEWAPGFHLTSLLLYIAGIASVWFASLSILRRFKDPSPETSAFLAASLFALHPWHVEAVNLQVLRNVLLSGLFAWLSIAFFIRALDMNRKAHLAASMGFFFLALGSKVDSAALPLALAILAGRDKRRWPALIPFFLLAALAVVFHGLVYRGADRINPELVAFGVRSPWLAPLRALVILPFFVGKGLWPIGVHPGYGPFDPAPGILSGPGLIGLAVLMALILGAWASWKANRKGVAFGLVWFLVTILPYLHLLPVTSLVGDRHAFLASFGLCLSAGALLGPKLERAPHQRIWAVATLGLLVALAAASFDATRNWKDTLTLFQESLKKNPENPTARTNVALFLWEKGRREEALELWPPGSAEALWFRGKLLMEKGQWSEAKDALKRAWHARGQADWRIGLDLAKAYEGSGNLLEAAYIYHKLETLPVGTRNRAKAHRRLERIWKTYKPTLASLAERAKASFGALFELAMLQDRLGMDDQALETYSRALGQRPRDWRLHYNRANVLKRLKRYREAAQGYRQAIALGANTPHAYNNLGLCLIRSGQKGKGIETLEDAAAKYPNFPYPAFNLGRYFFSWGDKKKARYWFQKVVEITGPNSPMGQAAEGYLEKLG